MDSKADCPHAAPFHQLRPVPEGETAWVAGVPHLAGGLLLRVRHVCGLGGPVRALFVVLFMTGSTYAGPARIACWGSRPYGIWRTRGQRSLDSYLRGRPFDWAGSRSAFPSWPPRPAPSRFSPPRARAYESGLGFVQNYFGLPLGPHHHRGEFPADLPSGSRSIRPTSFWASASTPKRGCWARPCSCSSAGWPRASRFMRRRSS